MMEVIDAMAHRDLKAGELIIEQGSKDGKEFYVLYEGDCILTKETTLNDNKSVTIPLSPTTGEMPPSLPPCAFVPALPSRLLGADGLAGSHHRFAGGPRGSATFCW